MALALYAAVRMESSMILVGGVGLLSRNGEKFVIQIVYKLGLGQPEFVSIMQLEMVLS